MTIVKELNNLSEKVTGKNAKAYTDAQAVKFIAENYEGGGSGPTYTAGDNITIEDNVISAVDTTYTAGENITITDGVISATASGGGNDIKTINLGSVDYATLQSGGEAVEIAMNSGNQTTLLAIKSAILSNTIPIVDIASTGVGETNHCFANLRFKIGGSGLSNIEFIYPIVSEEGEVYNAIVDYDIADETQVTILVI